MEKITNKFQEEHRNKNFELDIIQLKKILRGQSALIIKGETERCKHIYFKFGNYIPTSIITEVNRFIWDEKTKTNFFMPIKYNAKKNKCYIDLHN